MDDWQDAALTTRHFHNRAYSGRGDSKRPRAGCFDVKNCYGTYKIHCTSAAKVASTSLGAGPEQGAPAMEIYRLTEEGDGVLGSLTLPGVLDAAVVLAGSRKALDRNVRRLEAVGTASDGAHAEEEDGPAEEGEREDMLGISAGDNAQESPQRRRFETFEKNSFRAPKFWFRWRGRLNGHLTCQDDDRRGKIETGVGYLVFAGSSCQKFDGTISCQGLGWENVSFRGWKTVGRSDRDTPISWLPTSC